MISQHIQVYCRSSSENNKSLSLSSSSYSNHHHHHINYRSILKDTYLHIKALCDAIHTLCQPHVDDENDDSVREDTLKSSIIPISFTSYLYNCICIQSSTSASSIIYTISILCRWYPVITIYSSQIMS
jgi:hypothetical protein